MGTGTLALHIHSNYSDGGSSVPQLVQKLINAQVKGSSLCDHDTISGVEQFQDLTKKAGIESITCFELSTCHDGVFYIHILAYGFSLEKKATIETGLQKNCRAYSDCFDETLTMINKKFDLSVTTEEIRKFTNRPGKTNSNMSLFQYLTANFCFEPEKLWKFISSGKESPMKQLLPSGKLMTLEEGMDFIVNIGATPVLAHPGLFTDYSFKKDATEKHMERMFEILLNFGLKGAEYYYAYPEKPGIRLFADVSRRLINKYGLWKLSGSDYHGPYKENSCGIAMPGMSFEEFMQFKAFCEK